ncbi:MAG: putative secreted protein [Herbinix sp.]|jgi:hypothetical protein|nr:putative secreted protein [Herbinix sp.]
MKKIILYTLLITAAIIVSGCGKGDKSKDHNEVIQDLDDPKNNAVTQAPTLEPTVTEVPEVIEAPTHEGEMRSYLTGLWLTEELGKNRPYAIQLSNFKTVRNQSGIGQADIVYEALVEGGITRLLAIGQNFTGDRIGSMRSSRHYFVSIAEEYDAIYIHYGKTKYAKAKLKELDTDNLDGESSMESIVFYRDDSLKAPHNAFTSIDRILKGIEKKKYETKWKEDYKPHYSFYETDTDLTTGQAVNKISIDFSSYNEPYLEYNSTDKLYYRYQFGGPHIDSVTGTQLSFKNVIVQFVDESDIDRNDYQTMDFEDATGSGYYITNGKMILITWKKKESTGFMRYYNEAGEELTINAGKTYIAIFPDNRTKDVKIN